MDPGHTCPLCRETGHLIGHDERGREILSCLTVGCDVAEYDRDLILRRWSAPIVPAHLAWQRPRGLSQRYAVRTTADRPGRRNPGVVGSA
jgi:hypothetical protein